MNAKDFYKERHPNMYSDSVSEKQADFTREMFDYYLDKLTSRSEEYKFQEFCRELAQKEICPNLIPQTGPTGGGDSKVDTETYPVSDDIALTWFAANGREAAKEKWAFAISAVKEWKGKLKSDIEKIAGTGRGYTKAFFFSNQFISDKKKADMQDGLKKQYGMDITILDKTWLLDKVFNNNHLEIAIKTFNLSTKFERKIGPRDYKRNQELVEVEKTINDCIDNPIKQIDAAQKSVILSRELELPLDIVNGKFQRLEALVQKHGNIRQLFDCLYDWAWTLNYWYEEYEAFYDKYVLIEQIVKEHTSLPLLEKLSNLFMILHVIDFNLDNPKYKFTEHTNFICNEFSKLISDKKRPNLALNAKAGFMPIKLLLLLTDSKESMSNEIDNYIDEYKKIIIDSKDNFNFDMYSHARIILENLILKQSIKYDELFELITNLQGNREQELSIAQMLTARAYELIDDKPYTSINYLGKALIKLYKDESKGDFIKATAYLALAYEKVGLYWAARQYYMVTLCYSINYYFSDGEIHPAIFVSLDNLRNLEMRFGRVLYSAEYNKLLHIFLNIAGKELPKENVPYDMLLAVLVLKTSFDQLCKLEKLPDYFAETRLDFPEISLKYLLGHYDEDLLKSNGSKEKCDEFMGSLYHQPARLQLANPPFYGVEKTFNFNSKIVGCKIKIISDSNYFCMELASSIISGLESFLATAINNKFVILKPDINIKVNYVESQNIVLQCDYNNDDYDLVLMCSDLYIGDISKTQNKLFDLLPEVILMALAKITNYDFRKDLEKIIVNELLFDRAISMSGNFFLFIETLGKDAFEYTHLIDSESKEYKLNRLSLPLFVGEDPDIKNDEIVSTSEYKMQYGSPDVQFDVEEVNQKDIDIISVIDISLWNKASWKGVAYISYPYPPTIVLIFGNPESGNKVFEKWIKEFGAYDKDNNIKIGIVKGIDKKRPFDYRVIVTGDKIKKPSGNYAMFLMPTRMHTMNTDSHANLAIFETAIKGRSEFFIMPGYVNQTTKQFDINPKLNIKKNLSSISLEQIQNVKEDSFILFGLIPSDDPDIKDTNHCVIKRLNQLKKQN